MYTHVSYTEFHSNRKINAERRDRKLVTPEVKWAFDLAPICLVELFGNLPHGIQTRSSK